jgi:hypothetical protein
VRHPLLPLAIFITACAVEPTEPELPAGVWKRSFPDKGVIDELILEADGTFTWTSYLHRGDVADSGQVTGTYGVDPGLLVLHGTTGSGRAFTLLSSYAHDGETLALGAYLPTGEQGPAYRAQWQWLDADQPVYSWEIMPEVWMHEGSYGVAWIDPIWKTQKSEGGDYVETPHAIVLDEQFTFDRIGDAFVRDDGWDPGLLHDALWWDLGLVFTRAR